MIETLIYLTIALGLVIMFFGMGFVVIANHLGLTGTERDVFLVAYPFLLLAYWFVGTKVVNAFKSITT